MRAASNLPYRVEGGPVPSPSEEPRRASVPPLEMRPLLAGSQRSEKISKQTKNGGHRPKIAMLYLGINGWFENLCSLAEAEPSSTKRSSPAEKCL